MKVKRNVCKEQGERPRQFYKEEPRHSSERLWHCTQLKPNSPQEANEDERRSHNNGEGEKKKDEKFRCMLWGKRSPGRLLRGIGPNRQLSAKRGGDPPRLGLRLGVGKGRRLPGGPTDAMRKALVHEEKAMEGA